MAQLNVNDVVAVMRALHPYVDGGGSVAVAAWNATKDTIGVDKNTFFLVARRAGCNVSRRGDLWIETVTSGETTSTYAV